MLLQDALVQYEQAKRSDGLTIKTVVSYIQQVQLFIDSLPPGKRRVGLVTASDIDKFMADERQRLALMREARVRKRGEPVTKRDRDASPATMRARHRALDLFFSWLEDNDEIGNPRSPLRNNNGKKRKPPKKGIHEPRRAEEADLQLILQALPRRSWLDHRDRAIVQLMMDTGLRAGEVCGLLVRDVDMNQREIYVRSGKGDKDRRVPFTEKTQLEASFYLMRRPACSSEFSPFLFLSATNAFSENIRGVLSPGGLGQLWEALSILAHVGKITPHMVRHYYGLKALNDGVRLETVSKLMGHADPGFTMRIYAPLLTSTMRDEYKRYFR